MIEFHVTYANESDAMSAASSAISQRLAACANVLPGVRSLYRWQGRVEDETETLAIFKTSAGRADALAGFLAESHPYDTPAVIRHDHVSANPAYEDWIAQETASQ